MYFSLSLLACGSSSVHPLKRYEEWFPGVDYVDWCGVSLFQQPYDCPPGALDNCSMPFADAFATYCSGLGLPVMIAESTPFGGAALTWQLCLCIIPFSLQGLWQ
jgi:hypothetical protein